jgi:hypothetical protein
VAVAAMQHVAKVILAATSLHLRYKTAQQIRQIRQFSTGPLFGTTGISYWRSADAAPMLKFLRRDPHI